MRDVGFVTSNPNKVRVLEVIRKRGKTTMKEVSKFTRIPEVMLRGVLEELKREGFVSEEEGLLKLTPAGFEVLEKMRI